MKPIIAKSLGGVIYPLAVLWGVMLLIANMDSAAGAAEFAALGVFFMLLIATPIVLIGNVMIVVMQPDGRTVDYFKRGMILPGIIFALSIAYQTGLWDLVAETLFG